MSLFSINWVRVVGDYGKFLSLLALFCWCVWFKVLPISTTFDLSSLCSLRNVYSYTPRYVGVLKKFKSSIEGCVIEGQMDPAVVGKFKMTPLVTSMAKDLKAAAAANDAVSICSR